MKKTFFFLVILLLFCINLFSQSFPEIYSQTSSSLDIISCAAGDGNNNVIVTGVSEYYDAFDVYHRSMVTIKYNSNGGVAWTTVKSSTYPIQPNAMVIDGSGNIYITGIQSNATDNDFFIISYNSSGNERWSPAMKTYDGGSDDQATGIALDNQGYVYVTGYSNISHGYGTNYDMATIGYATSDGSLKWNGNGVSLFDLDDQDPAYHGSYYGHGNDYSHGIAVYNNVNNVSGQHHAIFICGKSLFNPYYTPHGGDTQPYGYAYMTVQLNTSDGSLDAYSFYKIYYSGYSGDGDACALAITVSQQTSNVYTTGYKPKEGGTAHSPDCITMQNHYGLNGCFECEDWCASWVDEDAGSCFTSGTDYGEDQGNAVTIVDNSDPTQILIYTAGYTYQPTATSFSNTYDYLVLKYHGTNGSAGTCDEHYPYDNVYTFDGAGNGTDKANSVCTDGNGNVWVTGNSYSGSSYGWADIVTIKLSSSLGSPTSYTFDGSGHTGDLGSVVTLSGSYVYSAGTTNVPINVNTNSDYVTLQYSTSDDKALLQVRNSNPNIPRSFSLNQNYPNPFNPSTTISYALPQSSYSSLKIYNILGQKVMEFPEKYQEAGNYSETINALSLASGLYFYRLEVRNAFNNSLIFSDAKKMLLVK